MNPLTTHGIIRQVFTGIASLAQGPGHHLLLHVPQAHHRAVPREARGAAPALPREAGAAHRPGEGHQPLHGVHALREDLSRTIPSTSRRPWARTARPWPKPAKYLYNLGTCMFCNLCVEVCPFFALVMSDEHELATDRQVRARPGPRGGEAPSHGEEGLVVAEEVPSPTGGGVRHGGDDPVLRPCGASS